MRQKQLVALFTILVIGILICLCLYLYYACCNDCCVGSSYDYYLVDDYYY